MNWSSLETSLQPSYIPNAAWPAVFANLAAEFGPTTASYLGYLDDEATYLSQLGEYTDDVQRLFAFRRGQRSAIDIDFFDLRQRGGDVVALPERHQIIIGWKGVD